MEAKEDRKTEEIKITPEIIEAGCEELDLSDYRRPDGASAPDVVRAILVAAFKVAGFSLRKH